MHPGLGASGPGTVYAMRLLQACRIHIYLEMKACTQVSEKVLGGKAMISSLRIPANSSRESNYEDDVLLTLGIYTCREQKLPVDKSSR